MTTVQHGTQTPSRPLTALTMCLSASSAALTPPPPPLLRGTRLPLFSFQKSLSLSEWPFTARPFAKCLPLQQSRWNQCEQSGQMIFRNDLFKQFITIHFFSAWNHPGERRGPRLCLTAATLQTESCVFSFRSSLSSPRRPSGIWLRFNMQHPTRE